MVLRLWYYLDQAVNSSRHTLIAFPPVYCSGLITIWNLFCTFHFCKINYAIGHSLRLLYMWAVATLFYPNQLRLRQCCRKLLCIFGFQDLVITAPHNQALLLNKRNALADCITPTLNECYVCLSPTCTASASNFALSWLWSVQHPNVQWIAYDSICK